MPDYVVHFYNSDPYFILSQTVGGTATWTGAATADGRARITDSDGTLEDNTEGETATAQLELGATSSSGVSVSAEESWTLYDTVTGETFQVITFHVQSGPLSGYYTISEVPLVAGRSYETLAFDTSPDVESGDPVLTYADVDVPDHIVEGTAGDDTIDASYSGDPEGDQVDDGFAGGEGGNDNLIQAGAGDDSVSAGLGDDTVEGGTGDDTIDGGAGDDSIDAGDNDDVVDAGAGDDAVIGGDGGDTIDGGNGDDSIDGGDGADSIEGGAGNDTLEGGSGNDTILGDDSTPPTSSTEFLDWAAEGADGTSVAGGFTQSTGGMDVSVSFTDTGDNNPTFLIESSDTGYVDTGESYDPNSMLRLYGNGDGDTSTTTIDFASGSGSSMSDEVENVSFRINDIDFAAGNHLDQITITAFDADGNPVAVTLTAAGDDTVDSGTGSITAGGALDDPDDANGSVLVEIAGPVQQIVIDYGNGLTVTQAIFLSDVYFDTIPDLTGGYNDVIDGGSGADSIDGAEGADTITGGIGDDTMSGGDGDDVFVLEDGSGADVITDFDTGDDDSDGSYNDQLDVSGLTDAGGNPVNAWDVVVSDDGSGNALLTFPNGETILLQGVAPAEVTGAQLLNAAGIPCFTPGTLIATPQGERAIETLRPGDLVLTEDNGAQSVRWIGQRDLGPVDLILKPDLKPILIPEGTCGNHTALLVSPLHGMMLERDGAQMLARARHLAEAPGPVRVAQGKKRVSYIHLMFDRHQIIRANGAATESFYPGDNALAMLSGKSLETLSALLPGLGTVPVADLYGPTARPFLKRKEVVKGPRIGPARRPDLVAAA